MKKVKRKHLENFGAAIAVIAFISTVIAIGLYSIARVENANIAICASIVAMFIGFVIYIFGYKIE